MNEMSAQLRGIVTDAIRFWEKGRVAYNILLAIVYFLSGGLSMRFHRGGAVELVVALVSLAVIANLLYCSAYVIDVFVQFSVFQDIWRRYRWMLLVFGCLFAAGLAHVVTQAGTAF